MSCLNYSLRCTLYAIQMHCTTGHYLAPAWHQLCQWDLLSHVRGYQVIMTAHIYHLLLWRSIEESSGLRSQLTQGPKQLLCTENNGKVSKYFTHPSIFRCGYLYKALLVAVAVVVGEAWRGFVDKTEARLNIVWKKTKLNDGSGFCPNITVTSVETLYYIFPTEL